MKKNNQIITFVVAIILLTVAVVFTTLLYRRSHRTSKVRPDLAATITSNIASETAKGTTTTDIMTPQEMEKYNIYHRAIYETTRDSSGKIIKAQLIGMKDPEPLKLDLMTDKEKEAIKMATSTKVQVLERDPATGKIKAYRLMKNDDDILKEY
jgi:hypothetical protein